VLLGAAFLLTYRLTDVPPGLHVDAAADGLDAQDVLRGRFPLFFPANYGRGPAYVYFEAALMALAGVNRAVYAFATIAMGLLGVALTNRLARLMFGPAIAVLASAFMAASIWVVFVSRIGVWATMMPAVTVAPLYFLWRGLRGGRRRDFLAAGALLGLSQYAYYATRFLPLLMVALCLIEWPLARKRLRLLAAGAALAVAVFLPEGVYLALHPQIALQRPQSVSIFEPRLGDTVGAIGRGLVSTAGMFFVRGDWRPWQNVPFRPVFDWPLTALFCAGLMLALVRWRNPAYRWLLVWVVVMLLPTALTSEPPSNFRAYGAAPAAFMFPAVALVWVWRVLRRPGVGPLLATALIAAEGVSTFDAYFNRWGASAAAAVAFDAHDTTLAAFAMDHPGATIYFSDIRTLAGQPARALAPSTQVQGWYPEDSAAIPVPAHGPEDVLYAGSPRSAIGGLAPEWLPNAQRLASTSPDDPRGYWAFRWPEAARTRFMAAQRPFDAAFGQDLRVASYAAARSGDRVGLDLVWEQLQPAGPYDLYTHVFDASGKQVTQDDKLYFPVERLGLAEHFGEGTTAGQLVLTHYSYPLPPGRYDVEIGVVHRSPANLDLLLAPAGPAARLRIDI
jgi:hypothetical protein